MKGLKKSMSIKAFCKRGLAVVLACAMVAAGFGPVVQTEAATITSGDEWITTANGLEVKFSSQFNGADGTSVMADGGAQESNAGDVTTVFDGNTSTGVVFRKALSGWGGEIQANDYICVEFKEAIQLCGISFAFDSNNVTDTFLGASIQYTTDGENWTELKKYESQNVINADYTTEKPIEGVTAVRLVNGNYRSNNFCRLMEITVNPLISPVYEKYQPGSAADGQYVEAGTYVIVGAHTGYSLNKAVNSGEALTYTNVAGNIENNTLTRIDQAYEWVITEADNGYSLEAADGDGYFNITESSATVGAESQLIAITQNTNYADSVAIGVNGVYLNYRADAAGTWTQADSGSAWYLYKFGYKISDMFDPDLLFDVWEEEIYTEESWAVYKTAKEAATEKLDKLYATEAEAKTAYETVRTELTAAAASLEKMIDPVAEKYVPGSNTAQYVEDGVYAILGARNDSGGSSINKAISSTRTLTYTNVAAKMVNDILVNPEKNYLWEITNVTGGYNLEAADGDGYLTITNNNDLNGATVSDEAQLINIAENTNYSNSLTIGSNAKTGYLNHRDPFPGTWTGIDQGSAWYLYKLGYKISETVVSNAISGVEDASKYTEASWTTYTKKLEAANEVYTTGAEARAAYDALVTTVDSLMKIEGTIVVKVGESYKVKVADDAVVSEFDSTIAEATTAVEEAADATTVLHDYTSGGNFSEEAGTAVLSDVEFTFTQNGEYWQINNGDTYIDLSNANNYFGTATDLGLEVVDAKNGIYRIGLENADDSGNTRYAVFYTENNTFDAYATLDIPSVKDTVKFNLTLLEKQGVVSADDVIPGYKLATSITSGKQYVISYCLDGSYIVLYPTNGQSNQTKKVGASTLHEGNVLTVKGVAAGTTNVWLGDKVYEVIVEDVITKGTNWINVELVNAAIVNGLSVDMTENPVFNKYAVYVSTDENATWTDNKDAYTLVCEGTWDADVEIKTTAFKPIADVYQICLVATEEAEVVIAEPTIITTDEVTEYCTGGSLRMDAVVPNPEEDAYGATSLRFVYVFPSEMNGLKVDTTKGSWYWNYATSKENFAEDSIRKDVTEGKWLINEEAKLVQSNIVFKDITRKNYDRNLYTTLTVTYSDTDGANTLTVYDTVIAERSVTTVATLLKDKYQNPVDDSEKAQYNYALGILGESAQ